MRFALNHPSIYIISARVLTQIALQLIKENEEK